MQLLRHDFNEPCCGKDQCDRESASTKTKIRSYVDAGNDLVTAEYVGKAVKYGFGAKNGMISVARVENAELSGLKIPNISCYHSYKFEDEYMVLWRYYDIGSRVKVPYNNLSVKPSIELLVPLTNTEGTLQRMATGNKKKKMDGCGLNTLYFCQQTGCSQSFVSACELEEHMLTGQHLG